MQVNQVVITGQHQVELTPVLLDERLTPEELLIETEYTFISTGTELANYTGKETAVFQPGSWCAYPWCSGYANVGRVKAVGSCVTRAKPGDRVFTTGKHVSVQKITQQDLIVPVPAALDPVEAVASRMAGVATSSVALTDLSLHPLVVVFGLGMVGNLAAQAYHILGGRVIGVDPMAARRELAERCGITTVAGGEYEAVEAAVLAQSGGERPNIVVDATGATPAILQALRLTADIGQIILLGTPRAPLEGNLTALLSDIHLRNITVRGALEWCFPNYTPTGIDGKQVVSLFSLDAKQRMIFDWLVERRMQVAPLVSHCLPATRIKEAYDGLLRQPEIFTGVALDWTGR